MDNYWISETTLQIESAIRNICDQANVSDRVTDDVLNWYTKIGLDMIDLLGTLYNRQLDDITELDMKHENICRPLWAALMYFCVPKNEKWIWKDEAMSLIMPFSIFTEAAERLMATPETVDVDSVGDIDENGRVSSDADLEDPET